MASSRLTGGAWGRALTWGPLPFLVVVALLVAAPVLVSDSNVFLLTGILIWAIFAISYNLLLGYTGVVSLGHAAFFGIGGYTVALILVKTGLPFVVAFVAAPLVAAGAALIMGALALRLAAIYFALFTLAVGQIVWSVANRWTDFTGGDNGLNVSAAAIPDLISSRVEFYFFTLVLALFAAAILYMVVNSPFGFTLRAIRENSNRVEFVGIPVRRYKLLAFVISGLFTGLAGSLLALHTNFVHPENLFWLRTAEVLLMVLLGGFHIFWGPALGAGVFLYLENQVRNNPYDQTLALTGLAIGGLAVVVAILFPLGIGGLLQLAGRMAGGGRGESGAQPPGPQPLALRWRTAIAAVRQRLGVRDKSSGGPTDSQG